MTALLKPVSVTVGADGAPAQSGEPRMVFVNPMRVGSQSWAAARSAGLHADAQVQLRSCDYAGEQEVTIDGVPYDVERVADRGEFTTLTLARRVRSGAQQKSQQG